MSPCKLALFHTCVVWAETWVGVHAWFRDQRRTLSIFLHHSVPCYFEKGSLAESGACGPSVSAACSFAVTDTQGTTHRFYMGPGTWTLVPTFVQQVLLIAGHPSSPHLTNIYPHCLLLVSYFTGSFIVLLDPACSPHIAFCDSLVVLMASHAH